MAPKKVVKKSMVRMIAVWGSPGSGKGVVSVALATQLASLHKNTVIISGNSSVPALPVYLPKAYIGADGSLGALLNSPMQNASALKGFIHLHPGSERIGVMGLASGESTLSYNAFDGKGIARLQELLDSSPFDYILFDCESNPTRDSMTLLALQNSDHVLRILTPDVMGIEFEKSHLSWMTGAAEIRNDEHIRIISPIHSFSPLETMQTVAGKAEYMLPFSNKVYGKYIAGELISGCSDRYGIQFDKQVRKLAERIVRDDPRTK